MSSQILLERHRWLILASLDQVRRVHVRESVFVASGNALYPCAESHHIRPALALQEAESKQKTTTPITKKTKPRQAKVAEGKVQGNGEGVEREGWRTGKRKGKSERQR